MNNIKLRPVGRPSAPVVWIRTSQKKHGPWNITRKVALRWAGRQGLIRVGLRAQS